MKGRRCGALAALVLLIGCDASATRPTPDGGLALEIVFSHDGPVGADAGTVRIRGATTMNISLAPGTERFIDLDPGSYVISLEALAAGEVVGFAQRSATVREGQVTTVTLTPSNFIPSITQVPATAEVDVPFTVQWTSVPGATGYRLEASVDPGFSTVQASETFDDTQAQVNADENVWFFRVRALTEFGSVGHPSAHTTGTDVLATGSAPVITEFQLAFLPVEGCPAEALDMATLELIEYQDEDGDVPGGVLGLSDVEAGYRFSGENDWRSYNSAQWEPIGGDGYQGELVGASCWDASADQEHLDVRVRIRDEEGRWSDWAQTRLHFPDAIIMDPDTVVRVDSSHQFTAVATFDGTPVPGDPITWSSSNTPELASVDQNGLYVVAGDEDGLDNLFARAVFTYARAFIIVPGTRDNESWTAPCWGIGRFSVDAGDWLIRRMRVYEGMEYRINLVRENSTATGDPDLYLGFNFVPDLDDHTAASTSSGTVDEEIIWKAPEDGVLWFGAYARTAFEGFVLGSGTTDNACGAPGGSEYPPSPAAGPARSMRATGQALEELRGLVKRGRVDHRPGGAIPHGSNTRGVLQQRSDALWEVSVPPEITIWPRPEGN